MELSKLTNNLNDITTVIKSDIEPTVKELQTTLKSINSIVKEADKNGMTFIIYTAWYLIAEVNLRRKDLNVANGILSNTLIQIEKNSNSSEYLLMLFKYSMFKVQMYLKEYEKAEICMNHARYIAAKYGINFNFDIDPSHYIYVEESTEENINETVQERESE